MCLWEPHSKAVIQHFLCISRNFQTTRRILFAKKGTLEKAKTMTSMSTRYQVAQHFENPNNEQPQHKTVGSLSQRHGKSTWDNQGRRFHTSLYRVTWWWCIWFNSNPWPSRVCYFEQHMRTEGYETSHGTAVFDGSWGIQIVHVILWVDGSATASTTIRLAPRPFQSFIPRYWRGNGLK